MERQLAAANDPYLIDLQIQDGRILGASVPALEEARVEYAAFSKDNGVTVPATPAPNPASN